jgi:hypothetical protein
LRQISLPVAASIAASARPPTGAYITPSITTGLKMLVPVMGTLQATWSLATFFVLI